MRCEKCNIDLPESYGLCPLCGGKPDNAQANLRVSAYVPYSKEAKKDDILFEKENQPFCAEKLKAFFNL
ncbi:MAG: hypothetical protein ACI4SB_03660 [Acutalibacteraceae bacterium]